MTNEEKDNLLINLMHKGWSKDSAKVRRLKKEIELLNDRIDQLYEDEELLREEIEGMQSSIKQQVDDAYLRGWKQGASQVAK